MDDIDKSKEFLFFFLFWAFSSNARFSWQYAKRRSISRKYQEHSTKKSIQFLNWVQKENISGPQLIRRRLRGEINSPVTRPFGAPNVLESVTAIETALAKDNLQFWVLPRTLLRPLLPIFDIFHPSNGRPNYPQNEEMRKYTRDDKAKEDSYPFSDEKPFSLIESST